MAGDTHNVNFPLISLGIEIYTWTIVAVRALV